MAGFEAGADDYLAKPFSPRELEYRVEALLRRGSGSHEQLATVIGSRLAIWSWTGVGTKCRARANGSI